MNWLASATSLRLLGACSNPYSKALVVVLALARLWQGAMSQAFGRAYSSADSLPAHA